MPRCPSQCLKITEKVTFNIASGASYVYILRFFAKDCDNVFRGKVAAIDETFETIDEAGKCFSTISHKTFMNQFVDENHRC